MIVSVPDSGMERNTAPDIQKRLFSPRQSAPADGMGTLSQREKIGVASLRTVYGTVAQQ